MAGRVVERDLPGKTVLTHWDAPQGIGALSYVQTSDGPTMTYGYDAVARLTSRRWDVGGVNGGALPAGGNSSGAAAGGTESFTVGLSYDSNNRPDTLTYPAVLNHPQVSVRMRRVQRSLRRRAPICPGFVQASASCRICACIRQ